MSIQCCNRNIKFTTFSQRRYYKVAPTLCQFCEERKMWTIIRHMITFPQLCLKFAKKFNKWHLSGMQGRYFDIKFSLLSPSYAHEVLKTSL